MKNSLNICSAHQPAFLPWCGYVHKLMVSDVFVFMDLAKFRKRSFMHRNMIEINSLEHFLGLRLSKSSDLLDCNDVEINKTDISCIPDIVKKIEHTYKRSPFKNDLDDFINFSLVIFREQGLVNLCMRQLLYFKKKFNIQNIVLKESGLFTKKEITDLGASNRLLNHALRTKSEVYLTGINSKDYLDKKIFKKSDIKHVVLNFDYSYFQEYQESAKPLSIVHQIAIMGFEKINFILKKKQISKEDILNYD